MNTEMTNKPKPSYTDEEKLKAAYALNMCTVSVSQMVDYHDSYIMEQEYDAILNNLNLKEIPKDEALLNIIKELLNTITYFRIQEVKKRQIDKRYEQRMSNAIWSAIPNPTNIIYGKGANIAFSLVTQLGTGYMNYRKEKANAKLEKYDNDVELEITAIEQLNALKRELFTTAWRLADEYDFDDKLRLTEKQIKQYNEILMDQDEYRKYSRLESIANNFNAYPPFWYFYGHTANYIAENAKTRIKNNKQNSEDEKKEYKKDCAISEEYTRKAHEHFEHYWSLCKNSILREDQITASFALEYVDILWQEKDKDTKKIKALFNLAEKMAPTSFDILQLCAISYLKIGEANDAARILKILVNENYNTSDNAKLLSRIYVSKFLFGTDEREKRHALAEYQILSSRIDDVHLFPLPESKNGSADKMANQLQARYMDEQIKLLQRDYRLAINEFIKSCIIKSNKLWPVPCGSNDATEAYFNTTIEAQAKRKADVKKALESGYKQEYIQQLKNSSLRTRYIGLLNDVIRSLEEFTIFNYYEDKDDLLRIIRNNIFKIKDTINVLVKKLETKEFTYGDYDKLQENLSFKKITEEFFDELKKIFMKQLDDLETLGNRLDKDPKQLLEILEIEVDEFCMTHSLKQPNHSMQNRDVQNDILVYDSYFECSIFGGSIVEESQKEENKSKMLNIIKRVSQDLIKGGQNNTALLLADTERFNTYFDNADIAGSDYKSITIAIIDDKTNNDCDLLLLYDKIIVIEKNKETHKYNYNSVRYVWNNSCYALKMGSSYRYANDNINIRCLYDLIQELGDVSAFAQ